MVVPQRVEIDLRSLELLPYGIVVVDQNGMIVYYNEREEQIAGRNREDVLGKNFFLEVAPCTNVKEFFGRFEGLLDEGDTTAEFDFVFPFKPRARKVRIAITKFVVEERTLGLIAVKDTTETEEIRGHILTSTRFAEVGEVASGVAHNFRNVLMSINTWAAILQREASSLSDRGIRALAELQRAVNDGRRMVERIRVDGSDALAVPSLSDVSQVAREAVEQARARAMETKVDMAKVSLELALPESLPAVLVVESELREVIVNLINNAYDATAAGGRIRVKAEASDSSVLITVRDWGTGMSEEVQEKLFRPLFTTKGVRGTGLGLSTSFAAVRRMGGTITVSSVAGEGSTFTVGLPRADAVPASSA
jgi:photoactive yellow protein